MPSWRGLGTPSVGIVTPGLCAQWRRNIHQPLWDTVGLWQLLPTPWQSCHHCPPSLPASQTLPHGPTHGTKLPGLSPAKRRSGGLPLGVHSHLPVPQQGCRDWGSLWMQQAGDGLSPGVTLRAALAMHLSLGSGLCPWLCAHFSGSTWFPQLDFSSSFPWAQFPVLTSVSSPAPPGRRFPGPGLLGMDLQARFSRHTLPKVSQARCPAGGSQLLPGALPISPVPAEGLPYQHSAVWKL